MAESKYIQSVKQASGERPRSTEWYKDKIKEFGTPGALDLIRDGKQSTRPFFGRLNMFIYDPKFKKTLPYYDTFHLHYLPIPLRIRLLDRLVDFSNNTKFDESTKLNVDYQKLKNVRLIRPTIHKYLAGQVKSRFRRIDADEFTIATLLPVQRFKKASASAVWKESRSMI